jgi:hypothetical protein
LGRLVEALVQEFPADDVGKKRVIEHDGEPHLVLGQLLAEKYIPVVYSPIPMKILSLLVQIEYKELMEATLRG